jgi:hypothetical protein
MRIDHSHPPQLMQKSSGNVVLSLTLVPAIV